MRRSHINAPRRRTVNASTGSSRCHAGCENPMSHQASDRPHARHGFSGASAGAAAASTMATLNPPPLGAASTAQSSAYHRKKVSFELFAVDLLFASPSHLRSLLQAGLTTKVDGHRACPGSRRRRRAPKKKPRPSPFLIRAGLLRRCWRRRAAAVLELETRRLLDALH